MRITSLLNVSLCYTDKEQVKVTLALRAQFAATWENTLKDTNVLYCKFRKQVSQLDNLTCAAKTHNTTKQAQNSKKRNRTYFLKHSSSADISLLTLCGLSLDPLNQKIILGDFFYMLFMCDVVHSLFCTVCAQGLQMQIANCNNLA